VDPANALRTGKIAQALAAGDPNRAGVERQMAREGVRPG
jgi:hypothetical protein